MTADEPVEALDRFARSQMPQWAKDCQPCHVVWPGNSPASVRSWHDAYHAAAIPASLRPSVPVGSREQHWAEAVYGVGSPARWDSGNLRPMIATAMQLADEENATLLAERDRARDLAAHLEEDSARQDTGREGDALKPPDA